MARTETIEWRSADDDPPETGKMVLLHCPEREEPDCEVFPVWPGYHDGIEWLWADGSCVEDDVIEWTDMPVGSSVDHQDDKLPEAVAIDSTSSTSIECACKSYDARQCFLIRHPECRRLSDCVSGMYDEAIEEECECACHYECDAEEFDL